MNTKHEKTITVIGCGRWGSCLAWYCADLGYRVMMYGISGTESYEVLKNTRQNGYLTLPDTISLTTDLKEALNFSDKVIISISSQNTPSLFSEIRETGIINKIYLLCMKGLIEDTGMRLSEVAATYLDYTSRVVVWVGPGHVENFTRRIPSCMLIVSKDTDLAKGLCKEFSSDLIRFYYSDDLIGNEVGAATKNVMGICAGILDGMGLSTMKGPLMARGSREIARLAVAMGGLESSIYGLSHLGDYEATLFSPHSHNRMFGECIVRGTPYDKLAEGYSTVRAVMVLAKKYEVDMPICSALYEILYNGKDPRDAMENLLLRALKSE